MIKHYLSVLALLASSLVSAQEVVATQGDSYSNSNATIDFTLGEVIIATVNDGTNELTQGFHQTNWNFLGVEDHTMNYEAIIFPNPTEDLLIIKSSEFENVSYILYDAQGKMVMQNILSAEQTPVQVSHLSPGAYSLMLRNETQNLKTFKLVKTN